MKTIHRSAFSIVCTCIILNSYAQEIIVRNNLALNRASETVSVPASKLKLSPGQLVYLRNSSTGELRITQWFDNDADQKADELIFQVDISANAENRYQFVLGPQEVKGGNTTYSRFVPERIDDFAWENDLVAFRTYGPRAQQIVEEGKPGGTLSSGMDCWLKRVPYPVIDKWYKKNAEGGSYHKDTGEGLDNYHVGASRGCGGLGVWIGDSLYVSKNFVDYKIIANGPIRTVFEITYAPWIADGIVVKEKKRISIDLGSQLSRYEAILDTDKVLPNCTVGITLHEKKGQTSDGQGWAGYWEPLDDSELGTGIIAEMKYFNSSKDYTTNKKDLSHAYIILKPADHKVVYYSGFGWKKAGKITTPTEWFDYLNTFSKRLASPLEVTLR